MKQLEIIYTLKSPLSHIGESGSVTSFLNDVQIVTSKGLQEIFIYSANAFRGLWRDLGARYLLDRLGVKLDLDSFHVLFSGGNISGTQTADIDQAKEIRSKLPFVSLFGGGVGNQILEGGMKVGFGYPICAETKELIGKTPVIRDYLFNISCGELTYDIQFSRMDDSKHELGEMYLEDSSESGKKKSGSASTQMRYEVEYLVPGAQLYQEVFLDCTPEEEGVFYRSLEEFAKAPFIGGMSGKGFGKVDFTVFEKGVKQLELKDDEIYKSENVKELLGIYDRSIDGLVLSGETIKEILGAKKK